MLLEGKKAIITGGTRGIGYAIACRFIEEGAAVTVFGSRQETADAAVEKLTAAYPEAKVWGRSCDLTSLEAVTEAFSRAAADMGGLDTVVNNAGISQRSPLLDYTAEEFAKVMDLNVIAVFNGHQAAAKIMTEAGHGGTITTTSSMVAKYGQPSGVGYPTSKFAVNGMVQSLSRELAPMGIRVNAVAPGVTKTDMVANLPEEVIKPIIATIPLGRMASPRTSPTPSSSWQAICPPTLRAPSSPSTEPPAPKDARLRLKSQQSLTQKARRLHLPQAARLLLFRREAVRLFAVVLVGFFVRIKFQHATAILMHGKLGTLQAATLARGELGRINLVAIGLIGKQVRRVHDAGIDVAARRLGGKTLGNRIERRQALEYATMAMRSQQLMLAREQAR